MPSYRPAVMVFSTNGHARVHLRFEGGRKGRSSRLYRLSGDGTPITARTPLPEGNKAIAFRVFTAGEREAWTQPAAPLREVPRFHDEINGTGSDVVHDRGEPGPGVLHYAGPSLIQLEALDDRLAYWVTVTEGVAPGTIRSAAGPRLLPGARPEHGACPLRDEARTPGVEPGPVRLPSPAADANRTTISYPNRSLSPRPTVTLSLT